MNTYKVITGRIFLLMLLVTSLSAFAEDAPFKVFETGSLNIKLSNDGTGVIKDIHCNGCDFNYVKITPASKATVNGVEVNIREARNRAGKFVMVSFNPETQEVQYIRWSE